MCVISILYLGPSTLHPLFLFVLQLLFVLFACMCLQTQVQSKLYKAEEQSFTEDQHESNQARQNETLDVRGKREVMYLNLTTFCKAANYDVFYDRSTSPSDCCVKEWHYCRGYAEPVCKRLSLGCYGNIAQFGFPKCTATGFAFKTIDNRKVKITTACQCAK